MKDKILLTGAEGFIGSHLLELLVKKNISNSVNLITDFILKQAST